ncbi:MAG: YicC/YloC family endoribonuclease [Candidatus Omnitrophota bacterium]
MIKSMTGFASAEASFKPFGKISAELRSSNHKFLEIVLHLPEGLIALEERIKKIIEAKIKRGRLTCIVSVADSASARPLVNRPLLQSYVSILRGLKAQYKIKDEISINALLHLPGVLSLEDRKAQKAAIWPKLKTIIEKAADGLDRSRQKEGRATYYYLKNRAEALSGNLESIEARFKKAIQAKLGNIPSAEERSALLKDTDISEELERLIFHIRNFKDKLSKSGPIGKELDFIAQEMQREANTTAAKSFDALISSKVVQIKSQIEKIREQVQNIE